MFHTTPYSCIHVLVPTDESSFNQQPPVEPIPEYTASEELSDEKNWRSVTIGDKNFKIDMKVIEPYKKVLSHGGAYVSQKEIFVSSHTGASRLIRKTNTR